MIVMIFIAILPGQASLDSDLCSFCIAAYVSFSYKKLTKN